MSRAAPGCADNFMLFTLILYPWVDPWCGWIAFVLASRLGTNQNDTCTRIEIYRVQTVVYQPKTGLSPEGVCHPNAKNDLLTTFLTPDFKSESGFTYRARKVE